VSSRPALLFYCQHSVGLGHLVRSFALADGLAERFSVVLACGGEIPDQLALPPGVDIVPLPAVGAAHDGRLVSRGAVKLGDARRRRRRLLLETLRSLRPRIVIVELFPFGRRRFADELVPLLEDAWVAQPRPLVVSSLRDILVGRERAHDTLSCVLANRYLDAVLVHSDSRFAAFEQSFRPTIPLRVPVRHTGFVVPDEGRRDIPNREPSIIVSAGGGLVGEELLRAALEARPLLPAGLRLELVAGPFLPDEAWASLRAAAREMPGLELHRFLPDLGRRLAAASVSVSQCGYNTALDVIRARVPALVVPFGAGREDEQLRRARRLERLGVVRVLEPARLDPPTLAAEVQALLLVRPRPLELDLDGARTSGSVLAGLTGEESPSLLEATAG
jgi:predicted glycosyltransferase